MTINPSNPPMFPYTLTNDGCPVTYPGMSLRDYFAAAAITGIIANGKYDGRHDTLAFAIADSMLIEREKESQ